MKRVEYHRIYKFDSKTNKKLEKHHNIHEDIKIILGESDLVSQYKSINPGKNVY